MMVENKKLLIGIVSNQFGNLNRGGAEVQVDNTVDALNKIKYITAERISSETRDLDRFDLFHFFNSSIAYYSFAEFLLSNNKPFVVSTIIYPENEKIEVLKYNILHRLPLVKNISTVKLQYYLWNNAAMLFPNTDKELDFIRKIGVKTEAEIVPNGLKLSEMEVGDELAFFEKYPFLKEEKFVLNVARIDRRKNQKRLVQACIDLNVPVVLIGNNLDKEAFSEITSLNYSKMYYLGPIYDKKILFGAYKACSVFCLPSTMETPGIAAMEAAYYNKPVVITKYGGTEYYFKDTVKYVEWKDVNSIKKGIAEMMLKNGFVPNKERMEHYTWENIAEMYVKKYNKILK